MLHTSGLALPSGRPGLREKRPTKTLDTGKIFTLFKNALQVPAITKEKDLTIVSNVSCRAGGGLAMRCVHRGPVEGHGPLRAIVDRERPQV